MDNRDNQHSVMRRKESGINPNVIQLSKVNQITPLVGQDDEVDDLEGKYLRNNISKPLLLKTDSKGRKNLIDEDLAFSPEKKKLLNAERGGQGDRNLNIFVEKKSLGDLISSPKKNKKND